MVDNKNRMDQELKELLHQFKQKGLKIGLALGSGSAKGLAHIGVIQSLNQAQIPIDLIAGTSIGAVVGSIYAAGVSASRMEKIVCSMKNLNFFTLLDPTIPHSGLLNGNRAVKFLEKVALKDKSFRDLRIPFSTVATDIKTGTEVILNRGSVIKAVRASFSIPGIFTSVRYQQYFLVDGGVVDPVPVEIAKKMGADVVIAVSLTSKNPQPQILMMDQETGNFHTVKDLIHLKLYQDMKEKYHVVNKFDSLIEEGVNTVERKYQDVRKRLDSPHIFEVINKSIDIMEKEITSKCIAQADIVIEPKHIEEMKLFEFNHAKKVIGYGREAVWEILPQLKEIIQQKIN